MSFHVKLLHYFGNNQKFIHEIKNQYMKLNYIKSIIQNKSLKKTEEFKITFK